MENPHHFDIPCHAGQHLFYMDRKKVEAELKISHKMGSDLLKGNPFSKQGV
jgi:hypothetical protein